MFNAYASVFICKLRAADSEMIWVGLEVLWDGFEKHEPSAGSDPT